MGCLVRRQDRRNPKDYDLGGWLWESRNGRASKCANELGGEGVKRVKPSTEKNRVKQKKQKQ